MSDLVNRLRWAATLGDLTSTSARNLTEEAAARIAALEAAVTQCRTLSAMLKPQADRIAELEAALQKKGCARDQKTTQYCSEVISRDARIAELEAVLLVLETEIVKLDLDYLDFLRVGRIINAALEGKKE